MILFDNKTHFSLRASLSPQKNWFSINVNCFIKSQQTYSYNFVELYGKLAPKFVEYTTRIACFYCFLIWNALTAKAIKTLSALKKKVSKEKVKIF